MLKKAGCTMLLIIGIASIVFIVYKATHYSQRDIDHVKDILLGNDVVTQIDMVRYDLNHDDRIDIVDLVMIKKKTAKQ